MHGRPSTRIMSFNSRPAKGATLRQRVLQRKTVPVSIHAPVKGATAGLMADRKFGDKFQFTPPRRGRPEQSWHTSASAGFNSRPREGGRRWPWERIHIGIVFQFTPPRRGRPHGTDHFSELPFVSIHCSLPREGGRHGLLIIHGSHLFVSIHAPAKGGDRERPYHPLLTPLFQFTPPRRGRPTQASRLMQENVSIHAPAKGATFWPVCRTFCARRFQFTPPRRGRP